MTEAQSAVQRKIITCPNGHQGTFPVAQQSSTLLYVPPQVNVADEWLVMPNPNQQPITYRCDVCGVRFSVEPPSHSIPSAE